MLSFLLPCPKRERVYASSRYAYQAGCECPPCRYCREGRLYRSCADTRILPIPPRVSIPHEDHLPAPAEGTREWGERQRRGEALLLALLTPLQTWEWRRHRAIRIPYPLKAPRKALLVFPERYKNVGWKYEFWPSGEPYARRNIWVAGDSKWSYEDELISLILMRRASWEQFRDRGCRDEVQYLGSRNSESVKLAKSLWQDMEENAPKDLSD